MRKVNFFTQSINHHIFDAFQFFHTCLRYEIRICDISEVINTKCRHGELVVHHRNRFYFNLPNPEWFFIYHVNIHLRYTGITECCESVVIILTDNVFRSLVTVDVDLAIFDPVKSPNIVQSPDMVFVFMCQQQSGHVLYTRP